LKVKLEQAATHTGIKPIYWGISNREKDAQPGKKECPE
jgi:hypothetical protein